MKKILLTSAIALQLFGCTKPEEKPLEYITEEYVFDPKDKNGFYAERNLNHIYSIIPNGFNRIGGNFLDAATDDAIPSQRGTAIDVFTKSYLNPSSNPDDAWAKNYNGIRAVNLFLSKIDIVPVPDKIPTWKAEARFLRAMFYFELVKRYGGVPLVGDQVLDPTAPQNFSRNSFQDCIDYIIGECNAVQDLVKPDALNGTDYGRVSKGVVQALKVRTLLYSASPLYNGGNIGESAAQKSYQGHSSYDAERWNAVVVAANELISSGKFRMHDVTFDNVFLVRRNNEVIFAYLTGDNRNLENNNGPIGYGHPNVASGLTSPTQDLVDAFPMSDGKKITESASYNAQNPYNGRDPRLARTVLHNGMRWLNRPLETFEGGLNKPNTNVVQTRTSYYLKKFLGNFATQTQYSNQQHNFPIFRYSDILLSYAEAKNEYLNAPDASVYQVLFDIRKRAGITQGNVAGYQYGIKSSGLSKEEMRELIRNERRIEMAFEEQRFWDLRRWKIAETELNKDLYGMKITQMNGGGLNFEKVKVDKVSFDYPKMYFYPIPFNEIRKNTNLVQNSGW